jgi:hypothetical protein
MTNEEEFNMTNEEEFNMLLEDIRNRADAIQQRNKISLDRGNVEYGLEMIEGYVARIRGLIYEEIG